MEFTVTEEVGRAQFNLATPTYAPTAAYVRTVNTIMIHEQNSFKITSRGVQG